MVGQKFLSYKNIVPELLGETDESHWEELRDFDGFCRKHYSAFVKKSIPYGKLTFLIDVLTVENGVAKMPEGIEDIVGVYGIDSDSCRSTDSRVGWNREIVGNMQTATDGSVYTLLRTSDKEEIDYDSPVVLAAKHLTGQMGIGQNSWLEKIYYGRSKHEGVYVDPFTRRFRVLSPRTSSMFLKGGDNKISCMNFDIPQVEVSANKYEFNVVGDRMEVGYESGFVLMSYKGFVFDKEGMVQFPYSEVFVRAIVDFIVEKLYVYLTRAYRTDSGYRANLADARTFARESRGALEVEMNKIGYLRLMKILSNAKRKNYGTDSYLDKTIPGGPDFVTSFENQLRRSPVQRSYRR